MSAVYRILLSLNCFVIVDASKRESNGYEINRENTYDTAKGNARKTDDIVNSKSLERENTDIDEV